MPGDPKGELGTPDWQADFSKDSDWFYFETEFASMKSFAGELMLTAKNPDVSEVWSLSWPVLSDFYLEYTIVTERACNAKDRYGMVLRAPDTNSGYLFGITCDGEFRLRHWNGEEFTDLVNFTPSEYINRGPNQVNFIGVKAERETLKLYINGHLVREVDDDTFLEGKFGAFIKSEGTPDFRVRVPRVVYWDLAATEE